MKRYVAHRHTKCGAMQARQRRIVDIRMVSIGESVDLS